MTHLTAEAITALVDFHNAARVAEYHDLPIADAQAVASDALSAIAGTGTPADEDYAADLGVDYICALDDGTIAAWGRDVVLAADVIGRDLVFIAPEVQRTQRA